MTEFLMIFRNLKMILKKNKKLNLSELHKKLKEINFDKVTKVN